MTTEDDHRYYPGGKEAYLQIREGVTPRMVAEHIVEHPYYGRDQQLAEGWLILIEAIESGEENPIAKLQEFVTLQFLNGNNNGVPQTKAEYESKKAHKR